MFKHFFTWILVSILLIAPDGYAQLVDPTRPTGFTPASVLPTGVENLTLTALMTSHRRYVAVINGQVLQPGGTIGGYKVLVIGKRSVRLQGINGTFNLSLVTPRIKTLSRRNINK